MQSITRRWLRGSLLISVLVLVLAEALFLSFCYQNLYGSTESALISRFTTIIGRLQATGTAGDTDAHRQQPCGGAAPRGRAV